MKIKSLRVYQAVYLSGKIKTNFSHHDVAAGVEMSLVDGIGVRVEDAKDAIIITFNNIASMQIEKDAIREAAKKVTKEHAATLKKLAEGN